MHERKPALKKQIWQEDGRKETFGLCRIVPKATIREVQKDLWKAESFLKPKSHCQDQDMMGDQELYPDEGLSCSTLCSWMPQRETCMQEQKYLQMGGCLFLASLCTASLVCVH